MIQTRQQAALGAALRSLTPRVAMHERSIIRCTLLYPAAALLLVVLLFQITGGQITRAEEAQSRYRQEATQYRQTANTYQTMVQALRQEERQGPRRALRALLEQQAAGYSYE